MILQLLFDLQARLRTGLAAGGMILLSDPRLPELQKKVGVLAAKSPVFQRLSNLLQSLADDPELFADRLLETLSLLEALLITQAEWKAEAAGEAIVLPAEKAYTDIRYSQLKPLIQALTTTGSGRYEIIEKTYQHHPERFPVTLPGSQDSFPACNSASGYFFHNRYNIHSVSPGNYFRIEKKLLPVLPYP